MSSQTARDECLTRWPSLRLTCRAKTGRYRVTSGPLFIASGKTAPSAWKNALIVLDKESVEAFTQTCREAWNKTLEQFGRGIQSASEGPKP